MSVNPLLRSNPVRMMGMASGMDTESIIQATLRMHQFKIDKQLKNRQLIEWKQKAHNDIKDQIKALKDTYLSNLGSKTMMNRNTFNTNLATAMQGGQVSTALTVSASVNSTLGSFRVKQVVSLAKGTSITSAGTVSSNGSGFDPAAKLGSLTFAGGSTIDFGASGSNKVDVNSDAGVTSITRDQINNATWSASGSAKYIIGEDTVSFTRNNSTGVVSYALNDGTAVDLNFIGDPGEQATASFTLENGDRVEVTKDENGVLSFQKYKTEDDENGDPQEVADGSKVEMMFASTATVTGANGGNVELVKYTNGNPAQDVVQAGGRTINDSVFYGEANITINGTTVTLSSNMTINDMVSKVNKEVSDVTMAYDRMNDVFTLTHKTIGAGGTITVGGSDSVIQNLFGRADAAAVNASAKAGTQAEIIVDDGTSTGLSVKSDSNTISFRGITIRVNHATEELTGSNMIDVTVKRDTDKAVDAIKDFINSYNTIIKKLEDMLTERKAKNEVGYGPLTDEEKSAMTEKQIEEWEAIAKKGILRNDKGIQDLVSKLRSEFFKEIEGTGYTASQLGLSTGSYFGGTGGQIIIDEEGEKKLRAALEADPDRVADVFVKIGTGANGQPEGKGLMHKLEKHFNDYIKMNGTQDVALSALEKSYNELNDRIAKLEERMWAEEDKLYRQFAAMETAMSKLQSQGDWFNAMLGG